jgi:tetratricopeptide (TPR) repeat protein
MTIAKKVALLIAVAASIAGLPDSAARAAGTGSSSMPTATPQRERTPEEQAKSAYNAGVKQLKKADGYDKDAAKASDEKKQKKARDKAAAAYESALAKFETAVAHNPAMHEAWNYIGYCQRHIGRYDDALAAYQHALQLKPGFPEAIEYRGEAYLGLNRLEDARSAYMDLFASSRPLAAQLLTAMQNYVTKQRQTPNGVDTTTLDAFANWVDERATIAQQTASLDPGATNASWR